MTSALFLLLALLPADTTRARLLATIEDVGDVAPIGEISGLAIDAAGRIYLADMQEPRILVFSSAGKLLSTIGRKGQGPGEFTAPTGPIIGPDGALYVRNMHQVLRFTVATQGGVLSKFDRTFNGPIMAPWRSKLASAIDRSGRFYFPYEVGLSDGLTHYSYLRYKLDGTYQDSMPVPIHTTARSSWASAQISPGTGRILPGLSMVPFHPIPQWTISPAGTMLSGGANAPELIETDAKETVLRRFSIAGAQITIPAAERAESLKALSRRLDSVPVALAQVRGMSEEVKQRRLPTTYPQYRGLKMVGDELWVIRWAPPPLRTQTVIDVVTNAGKLVRTIVLPTTCASVPALAVSGPLVACMRVDPETGAESVAISRLP
jgi:hypothetical protein